MRKYSMAFSLLICAACCCSAVNAQQIGDNPIPVLAGVTVASQVTYDPVAMIYNYNYIITNPQTNTGSIWNVEFDMKAPAAYYAPATGIPLTIPYGHQGLVPMIQIFNSLPTDVMPHLDQVIFFGETLPANWAGDISADGFGSFFATNKSAQVAPGQTAGGFVVYSPGIPTIKDMQLIPDWVLVDDNEPSADEEDQANAAMQAATARAYVLGPSAYQPLSEDQWNAFRADIGTAIQLGWISDATFGQALLSQLSTVRTNFDTNGPDYIAAQLKSLQQLIASSTASQRNAQAYELLSLNVAAMIASLPAPNPQPTPQPQSSPLLTLTLNSPPTNPVGGTVTFTAHVVDEAQNNQPISGYSVFLNDLGANPNSWTGITDTNGDFVVSYVGSNLGTDTVTLGMSCGGNYARTRLSTNCVSALDSVTFKWVGGPDMVIGTFVPPLLEWSGTGPIHITEVTKNVGTTVAGPSSTSYYISQSDPFNWNTAIYVGERSVPALQPGQSSSNGGVDWSLPAGIGPGIFTMRACADAHNVVAETDETNNCALTEIAVAMKSNHLPPVCTKAAPAVPLLWPPDHTMDTVQIQGVTDPSNLPLTLTVTGIQQDEPVNANGDGNTAPDGAGVGTDSPQVRAERSGIAQDGRLYFIAFKATDSAGAACTGSVTVGVPHDKGQHNMPVDNGERYDSTSTN